MVDEMVSITREEYYQLRKDSHLLSCLQQGGVDNWEWYGEAAKPHWEVYEDKE